MLIIITAVMAILAVSFLYRQNCDNYSILPITVRTGV